MPTSQEIYDKIEKLRLEKGMTVSQLNKLACISHCTLNTWKTRQTMPKIEVLDSLCYALGTTISAVLADIDCDKLAGDEYELLSLWRSLDKEQKNAIMTTIKTMARKN